jgi:hypothetical protein
MVNRKGKIFVQITFDVHTNFFYVLTLDTTLCIFIVQIILCYVMFSESCYHGDVSAVANTTVAGKIT